MVIGKQLLSQSQPGWLEDHEEFMIKAGRQLVDVKWTNLFLNTIVHAIAAIASDSTIEWTSQ